MTRSRSSHASSWLSDWLLIAVAALAIGGVFFIAEHSLAISTVPDFVADIDEQESWAAGGDRLRRAAFLGLAALGAAALVLHTPRLHAHLPAVAILGGALVLWAGASISWSIDPGTSLRRYLLLWCSLIGAVGIARLLQLRHIVLTAVVVFLGYLCLGVLTEISLGTFRPWAAEYRFAGSVHPNTQGAYLAVLGLALVAWALATPRHRVVCVLLFSLVFVFLLLTRSRTACAALLVALAAMAVAAFSPARRVHALLAVVWILSLAALAVLAAGIDPAKEYAHIVLMGRQEQSGSLTGRLPLWEDLWLYIRERPFAGYGYDAFWTPRHIYDISVSQEWTVSEAHSTYFSAWLQLGIVGVALLIAVAGFGLVHATGCYRATGDHLFLFLVGGIVFALLRGVTEAGMETPNAVTMMLAVGLLRALAGERSTESEATTIADGRALSTAELL